MSHDAFPVDDDFQTAVENSGLLVKPGYSYAGLGVWAQREFERRSGQIPFLKDTEDVARYFDPPGKNEAGAFMGVGGKPVMGVLVGGGRSIKLDAGLLTLTQVYRHVTYDDPDGEAMVLGQDFSLLPVNAAVRGEPYKFIEIVVPYYGQPRSVKVVGRWGYSETVPEDVWQCCLNLGQAKVASDVLQWLQSGPASKTTFDVEVVQSKATNLGDAWSKYADKVIGSPTYRMRDLGI